MTRAGRRGLGIAAVVFVASIGARWLNPLTVTGDINSDEATYVSMALSLVHDGNLTFEKADLDRFLAVYPRGPEGIFLKRNAVARPRIDGQFPFVHLDETLVPTTAHLAYGKAFIYPLVAAPFVALGGVAGMLVCNLCLILLSAACAVRFAQARTGALAGAVIGMAFIGASVFPVYVVWLMPEVFNATLIFAAYFLWLYKRVAPTSAWSGWQAPWTDVVAAALIGVAIYSKPSHVVMIGPPVAVAFFAREWRQALRLMLATCVVACGLFAVQIVLTGEWNYQGSIAEDGRKAFYDAYPFDAKGTQFETYGENKVTNDTGNTRTETRDVFVRLLPRNLWYFVVGRDAGLLPFYFPGLLTALLWLLRVRRSTPWQAWVALGFVASAAGWLVYTPYTWNGGGGAPGNRYILSSYPMLLFLLPPGTSALAGLVGAAVGLIFTAPMTAAPVDASVRPWRTVERQPYPELPVELTLINDLPLALLPRERWKIEVSSDPYVLFYYMDAHTYFMEKTGQWIAGDATADIIMRSDDTPLTRLTLEIQDKYVANDVTVSLLGDRRSAHLEPGGRTSMVFTPRPGVWYQGSYAEVLRISTTNGFVPAKVEPVPAGAKPDTRFLGVFVSYRFETGRQ